MIQLICHFFLSDGYYDFWDMIWGWLDLSLDSKESGTFFKCKIKSHLTNLLGSAILCHFIITTLMKIVSWKWHCGLWPNWMLFGQLLPYVSVSFQTINWNCWYVSIKDIFCSSFCSLHTLTVCSRILFWIKLNSAQCELWKPGHLKVFRTFHTVLRITLQIGPKTKKW